MIAGGLLLILVAGLLIPEDLKVPVAGADRSDWNAQSFWFEPWGSSGVHKGIDIFAPIGREVVAASGGVVLYSGQLAKGGEVIAILGPKWRIHYYAHLQRRAVASGAWVWSGVAIGTVGDTGNAVGKSPHLHYSILSLVPLPWKASGQTQGWKRMFYLDPGDHLD